MDETINLSADRRKALDVNFPSPRFIRHICDEATIGRENSGALIKCRGLEEWFGLAIA